jgi:glycosyltransferase involved in cell wall biosynthesis
VIIPCHGEGRLVGDAVRSVQETAAIELVVIDDESTDEETVQTLAELEAEGHQIIRFEQNRGVAEARMAGLAATTAPYIAPLDADDLAEPGALTSLARLLDSTPWAAAAVGDVLEFGDRETLRAVPDRLDPYRVAYTNEYPITAVFRRDAVEAAGAWRRSRTRQQGYEDWSLWMGLAERGAQIVHLGPGRIGYRRRLHGRRLNAEARAAHVEIYRSIRNDHPDLFARIKEHRRRSDLSPVRRALYPLVYGERESVPFQHLLKPWADRLGLWTLTRRS